MASSIKILLKFDNLIFLFLILFLLLCWIVTFYMYILVCRNIQLCSRKIEARNIRKHNTIEKNKFMFGNDFNLKTVQLPTNKNFEISNIQNQGSRDYQEDSFGISDIKDESKGILLILSDGMGGMAFGRLASETAVELSLQHFNSVYDVSDSKEYLRELTYYVNDKVSNLPEFKKNNGGATLILAHIYKGLLSFVSVGDSRICIMRNNKLMQLNEEHVFGKKLDVMVAKGEMDENEAKNNPMRHALTSFIGIEELQLIDESDEPISLKKGDNIILMSDGVFGTVNNDELIEILSNSNVQTAAKLLEHRVLSKKKKNQDNFTAVIMRIN